MTVTRLFLLLLVGTQDPASKPGLVLHARDGERDVIMIVPVPHFTLGARESLHPQLDSGFRATWTGRLKIIRGGTYAIRGNAKILIGGKEIQGKPVGLEPGEHPLRIEMQRRAGKPARLQLVWQSEFFEPEPMPSSVFVHRDLPPGAASFD